MGSGRQKRGCCALLRQRPVFAAGDYALSHGVHQQTGLLQLRGLQQVAKLGTASQLPAQG